MVVSYFGLLGIFLQFSSCIVRRILENNFVFVRRDDRDDKDDIQDPEDAAKTADDDTPYFDEDQIGTNQRGKIV